MTPQECLLKNLGRESQDVPFFAAVAAMLNPKAKSKGSRAERAVQLECYAEVGEVELGFAAELVYPPSRIANSAGATSLDETVLLVG